MIIPAPTLIAAEQYYHSIKYNIENIKYLLFEMVFLGQLVLDFYVIKRLEWDLPNPHILGFILAQNM